MGKLLLTKKLTTSALVKPNKVMENEIPRRNQFNNYKMKNKRINKNYSKTCHSRKEEQDVIKRFESKGWSFGGVRTYNGTESKFHSILFFHRA